MNATTTLTIAQDSFDTAADFTFEYKGYAGRTCTASGYLFQSDDGQIYLMKNSAVLKSHYSDEDRAERARRQHLAGGHATRRAAGIERPADAPTDYERAAEASRERGIERLAERLVDG